jgi:hypothetical protein
MAEVQVELAFSVLDHHGRPLTPERLHAQGAELMAALLDLEKCNDNMQDPATSSDADASQITAEMLMEADDPFEAAKCALTLCRTAIHTIGGSTPNWPSDSSTDTRTDFLPKNVAFDYV